MYSKIARSDPKEINLKLLHLTMANAPGLIRQEAAPRQHEGNDTVTRVLRLPQVVLFLPYLIYGSFSFKCKY